MRKLLFVGLIAISMSTSAQIFSFGIKAGANYPNLKIDKNTSISDINTDNGNGFHVGGMARIKLAVLYIQPELLYTNTNNNYSFMSDGVETSGIYHMQRLDVPIMAGFKLGPIAFFAGPVASFNLSSPDDIFNNGYETATLGYQAGIGVKLFRFLGEIKYEGPFGDATTSAQVGGTTFTCDSRTNMWILSFGYFFGKDKDK